MAYVFPLRRGPLPDTVDVIGGWRVTSWFGHRPDPLTGRPGRHGGMDLAYAACFGAEVIATADGTLVQSWDPSGGGRWSRLAADDGSVWGYGHANRYEPVGGVDAFDGGERRVRAGEVIAYVGLTGAVTGAHLHLAYRGPRAIANEDPYDVLTAAARAGRFAGERPTTARVTLPMSEEDDMPDQFTFPDGTTYVLSISPSSDTGFAWVHIGSPTSQADGRQERMLSSTIRLLAQGNVKDDALFERHPVLSGPHRRPTHV